MLTYSDGTTANLGKVKGEDGQDGEDGRGIQSMSISIDGELIVTYTDSTVVNLGNIKGEKGDKGDRGEKGDQGAAGRGIAKTELVNGELIIHYTDGTSDNLGSIYSETTGDTSYLMFGLLDNDTYTVRIKDEYISTITGVDIPSTYNGKKVTQITEGGFQNCTKLKRITIPKTITTINGDAFKSCSVLKNVYYEGELEDWLKLTISGNIYGNPCANGAKLYVGGNFKLLEAVEIPSSITSIKFATFYGCTSITSVKLHDNVKSIKRNAFRNCTNLTDVNIPASVKEIQDYAFYNSGLTNAEFELTDGWRIGEEELTYRYLEIEVVEGLSPSRTVTKDEMRYVFDYYSFAQALKGSFNIITGRTNTTPQFGRPEISYSRQEKKYYDLNWYHD